MQLRIDCNTIGSGDGVRRDRQRRRVAADIDLSERDGIDHSDATGSEQRDVGARIVGRYRDVARIGNVLRAFERNGGDQAAKRTGIIRVDAVGRIAVDDAEVAFYSVRSIVFRDRDKHVCAVRSHFRSIAHHRYFHRGHEAIAEHRHFVSPRDGDLREAQGDGLRHGDVKLGVATRSVRLGGDLDVAGQSERDVEILRRSQRARLDEIVARQDDLGLDVARCLIDRERHAHAGDRRCCRIDRLRRMEVGLEGADGVRVDLIVRCRGDRQANLRNHLDEEWLRLRRRRHGDGRKHARHARDTERTHEGTIGAGHGDREGQLAGLCLLELQGPEILVAVHHHVLRLAVDPVVRRRVGMCVAVGTDDAVLDLPPDRARGAVVVEIVAGLEEIDLRARCDRRVNLDGELDRNVERLGAEIEVERGGEMEPSRHCLR